MLGDQVSRARYQAPVPGPRRRVPYARVPAHVAPLGVVKTLPFRLWTFASFCANGALFALLSLQFGFVSGPFWVRFRFVFQGSSFVFKDFLASFPLFFIFCSSRLPPLAGGPGFGSRLGAGGHGLRRIVPGLNTLVGYHGSGVLSSENGYGPNLGVNAGFQAAVEPPRWRRYVQIRTAPENCNKSSERDSAPTVPGKRSGQPGRRVSCASSASRRIRWKWLSPPLVFTHIRLKAAPFQPRAAS